MHQWLRGKVLLLSASRRPDILETYREGFRNRSSASFNIFDQTLNIKVPAAEVSGGTVELNTGHTLKGDDFVNLINLRFQTTLLNHSCCVVFRLLCSRVIFAILQPQQDSQRSG